MCQMTTRKRRNVYGFTEHERAREQAGTGAITVTYTPMHSFPGNNVEGRRLHRMQSREIFTVSSFDGPSF